MVADALDKLTHFDAGTPMGEIMRQFWIPAVPSDRLVADGAPERVGLLGQRLVAFRDTDGRVGVLDEGCPHRGVSLVLARNEECGLRCLFHGWKIDVDGNVVDTPNEVDPEHKARVRAVAYPARESGGIVWVYLGGDEPPPLPALEFMGLPEDHVFLSAARVDANWLPVMEAALDQAHLSILHQSSFATTYGDVAMTDTFINRGVPTMGAQPQPWGASLALIAALEDGKRDIRVGQYVFPWWDLIRLGTEEDDDLSILLQVPVDDHTTTLWAIFYNLARPLNPKDTGGIFRDNCPRKTFRTDFPNSPEDNWGQDRSILARHWTGIGADRPSIGLLFEDIALLESLEPNFDHAKENLGPSDVVISRLRHILHQAVRAHERGQRCAYRDVDLAEVHPRMACGVPPEVSWQEATGT